MNPWIENQAGGAGAAPVIPGIPLSSAPVQSVAAWWQAARQGNPMPAKDALDPVAFPRALRNIWLAEHDLANGTFVYRLVGDDIRQLHGKTMKGLTVQEAYPEEIAGRIQGVFERVAKGPCVYHRIGKIYASRGRAGFGERLMLPLGETRGPATHVLGVSIYTFKGEKLGIHEEHGDYLPEEGMGQFYPLTG